MDRRPWTDLLAAVVFLVGLLKCSTHCLKLEIKHLTEFIIFRQLFLGNVFATLNEMLAGYGFQERTYGHTQKSSLLHITLAGRALNDI